MKLIFAILGLCLLANASYLPSEENDVGVDFVPPIWEEPGINEISKDSSEDKLTNYIVGIVKLLEGFSQSREVKALTDAIKTTIGKPVADVLLKLKEIQDLRKDGNDCVHKENVAIARILASFQLNMLRCGSHTAAIVKDALSGQSAEIQKAALEALVLAQKLGKCAAIIESSKKTACLGQLATDFGTFLTNISGTAHVLGQLTVEYVPVALNNAEDCTSAAAKSSVSQLTEVLDRVKNCIAN